jgi:hypothetical protein
MCVDSLQSWIFLSLNVYHNFIYICVSPTRAGNKIRKQPCIFVAFATKWLHTPAGLGFDDGLHVARSQHKSNESAMKTRDFQAITCPCPLMNLRLLRLE